MLNNLNTVDSLNQKWWYRLIKVIYIGSLLLMSFMILVFAYNKALYFKASYTYGLNHLEFIVNAGVMLISLGLIALLVRGCFYYIVLGAVSPKK